MIELGHLGHFHVPTLNPGKLKQIHYYLHIFLKKNPTILRPLPDDELMIVVDRSSTYPFWLLVPRKIVPNLRSEFNQLMNGGGYPYFQGTGQLTNNSNSHSVNTNHISQYLYALTPKPNLNFPNTNNQNLVSNQPNKNPKTQTINFSNAPHGKSYTVLQNVHY